MREIGAMREECQLAVPVGKNSLVAESQERGMQGRRERVAEERHLRNTRRENEVFI